MNDKIEELKKQCYLNLLVREDDNEYDMELFAELIIKECKKNFIKVWYEQGLDIRGAEISKFLTRFEEHLGVE